MNNFSKKAALLLVFLVVGCTGMRRASTGLGQALHKPVEREFEWGSVYCGEGVICNEIEVKRVDFENRNGGRVEVTLHNRTGQDLQAQIALEILNQQGARMDSTSFQNIGVPARSQVVWQMPGIYQKGSKIKVVLRRF